MATIERAGTTISFTDTGLPSGKTDAPTIVFGHGLFFGGWMYEEQIATLSSDYRCVAIDWRGQGDTPATVGEYDMDTLTDDALALIEHLGVAPVHWVGLSMGGFVGMRLAARHPEVLRTLTLLNTSSELDADEANRGNLEMAQRIRTEGIAPFRSDLSAALLGDEVLGTPEGATLVDRWMTRLGAQDKVGLSSAVVGVVERDPISAELDKITVPTLVVAGGDDKAIPADRGREIALSVAGAEFAVIPGAGHACTVDKPAETTAVIADFLRAHH